MTDEVLIYERWHWPHSDVMDLDFDDFMHYADGIREIYDQENKAREQEIAKARSRK